MKKYLLFLGGLSLFVFVPHVFAADGNFVPLTNIPGLTNGAVANSAGLANFFNNLYKYLIGIAAILAVVEIIWGGLEISTQDSVSKHSHGKERIQEAILGLVLVLSPALVFSIINPNIINLSLNLPPLEINTVDTSVVVGNSSANQTVTTDSNNVTTKVTGTYLQKATFSSGNADKNNSARDDWSIACTNGGGVGGVTTKSSCGTQSISGGVKTCTSASDASAICAHFSSTAYTFVNAGSRWGGAKLQPLSSSVSGVSEFKAACAGDNGKTCIGHRILDGGTFIQVESLSSCPESVASLPGNALGNCYKAVLFCGNSSNDAVGCDPNYAFYP